MASGSLAEVETFLILAERLQYLTEPQRQTLEREADEISRMLAGLKRSLQSSR